MHFDLKILVIQDPVKMIPLRDLLMHLGPKTPHLFVGIEELIGPIPVIMAHPTSLDDISMTINLPVVAVTEMAARLESTKKKIVEILKNPAPKESDLARKRSIPKST